MGKCNTFTKTALTVLLATAAIVGTSYAYRAMTGPLGPLETTEKFYQEWLNYQASPLADKLYQDHSLLSDDFEARIDRLVAGFDKGGFDPVLLAQDKPMTLTFELSRQSNIGAVVLGQADFGGSQRNLKVDLSFSEGRWLIDNISDPDAPAGPLANDSDLQTRVGDYIREHISDLSPEASVLGGTWYVTEIVFGEGNNISVQFEDGHIARTAGAQYELLPDGSVRIDNFEIIAEN
jgi:hypothetical protein